MARPDVPGAPMTDYEEVWRNLPFPEGPEGPGRGISWVLESDEGVLQEGQHQVTKIFLGRIWGSYLVLYQKQVHKVKRAPSGEWVVQITGQEVSGRREEWVDGHWETKNALGPDCDSLPSMAKGLDVHIQGSQNEKVSFGGCDFIVRAFERETPKRFTRESRL